MTWQVWGVALAMVLLFEGFFPCVAPARWRHLFAQLMRLSDGQIRFIGAVSFCLGTVLLYLLAD